MLINDKLLNNIANFYFRKNERLKDDLQNLTIDYLSLKFQIKIVDNTLNLKELIQNCKHNNHNDHVVPKVYGVAETKLKDKKICFLINMPIEGKYLSQINLSNLAFFKKIMILANYLTLIENINKEKLFFNFSNILINNKFELKYVGNPMNSYQHFIHLMANKFKKNNTHGKKTSINQFIELVMIMFPYLKNNTLFNINNIINSIQMVNKENTVAHLRTFLLQILYDVIETEKEDINKLFDNHVDDLSHFNKNFHLLLAIKKLLSEHIVTLTKIEKKDRNQTILQHSSSCGVNKNVKHSDLVIKQEVNLGILSQNINKKTFEIISGIRFTFNGNNNNIFIKKEVSKLKLIKRTNKENFSLDQHQHAPDSKLPRLNNIISRDTKEDILPIIPISLRINNRHIISNGDSYLAGIKPKSYGSYEHFATIDSNKNDRNYSKIIPENSKILKSINIYFPDDPKIDKNESNIINTKLYLNYKKRPIKDKKYFYQNTPNLRNSLIRENSGKRNIKNILQEHSSFNIGFLNKLISNRSSMDEHNIYDQKNSIGRIPRDLDQLIKFKNKK